VKEWVTLEDIFADSGEREDAIRTVREECHFDMMSLFVKAGWISFAEGFDNAEAFGEEQKSWRDAVSEAIRKKQFAGGTFYLDAYNFESAARSQPKDTFTSLVHQPEGKMLKGIIDACGAVDAVDRIGMECPRGHALSCSNPEGHCSDICHGCGQKPDGPVFWCDTAQGKSMGCSYILCTTCKPTWFEGIFNAYKRFIDAQIAHYKTNAPLLEKVYSEGRGGHGGMYRSVMMSVERDPCFESMTEVLAAALTRVASRFKGEKPRQTNQNPVTVYQHASAVRARYNNFVSALCDKSGCTFLSADAKGFFRAAGKLGVSKDRRWDGSRLTDLVRGASNMPDCTKGITCLELLLACDPAEHAESNSRGWNAVTAGLTEKITIVTIKDRWSNPSAGGWADAMVLFYFADDASKHIQELQLTHVDMMGVRDKMGAHDGYDDFRDAQELLEATGQEKIIKKIEAAAQNLAEKTAASKPKRSTSKSSLADLSTMKSEIQAEIVPILKSQLVVEVEAEIRDKLIADIESRVGAVKDELEAKFNEKIDAMQIAHAAQIDQLKAALLRATSTVGGGGGTDGWSLQRYNGQKEEEATFCNCD
jgi:hypothetical protein